MKRFFYVLSFLMGVGALFSSCNSNKTYAELLAEEKKAIRNFVSVNNISAIDVSDEEVEVYTDEAAWVGEDAVNNGHFERGQWYKFEDGLYMKIVSFGDTTSMFKSRQNIIVRYEKRYNLLTYENADSDYTSNEEPNSYWEISQWSQNYNGTYGYGVGFPVRFLGTDAVVCLIVPSKVGTSDDATSVVPVYYENMKYVEAYN